MASERKYTIFFVSSHPQICPLSLCICLPELLDLVFFFVEDIHFFDADDDVGHKFEYKAATCGGELAQNDQGTGSRGGGGGEPRETFTLR